MKVDDCMAEIDLSHVTNDVLVSVTEVNDAITMEVGLEPIMLTCYPFWNFL